MAQWSDGAVDPMVLEFAAWRPLRESARTVKETLAVVQNSARPAVGLQQLGQPEQLHDGPAREDVDNQAYEPHVPTQATVTDKAPPGEDHDAVGSTEVEAGGLEPTTAVHPAIPGVHINSITAATGDGATATA